VLQLLWEDPMNLTTVFEWFAQESISIAEQANEPERRETFTHFPDQPLKANAYSRCAHRRIGTENRRQDSAGFQCVLAVARFWFKASL
jgi:hypothetical protein